MIDSGAGENLPMMELDQLGGAERIVSSSSDTNIIGGLGDITEYKKHIDKDDERSEVRIATLEGRAAIIKIGGINETDVEEKNYRFEDAIAAAKAALRGGIVAGGGTTLVSIAKTLQDTPVQNAIRLALNKPYEILLENAGLDYQELKENEVLDVTTNKISSAIDSGIVDPSEVTQQAVRTAISVASISVTTGAIIDSTVKDS